MKSSPCDEQSSHRSFDEIWLSHICVREKKATNPLHLVDRVGRIESELALVVLSSYTATLNHNAEYVVRPPTRVAAHHTGFGWGGGV